MARAPSAWVFAVVPVVGFVLQEHVEHLVAHRELEISYFSTPFVLGLAPRSRSRLVALLAARIILGFVQGLARTIRTALTLSRPSSCGSSFLSRPTSLSARRSPSGRPAALRPDARNTRWSVGRPLDGPLWKWRKIGVQRLSYVALVGAIALAATAPAGAHQIASNNGVTVRSTSTRTTSRSSRRTTVWVVRVKARNATFAWKTCRCKLKVFDSSGAVVVDTAATLPRRPSPSPIRRRTGSRSPVGSRRRPVGGSPSA